MSRNAKLFVFFVARMMGIFLLFRLLTRSRIRILCYHGGCLGDESRYNPLLFCPSSHFEARIAWLLKKGFNVVPLGNAVSGSNAPVTMPRLPTVITFDDGWHSTATELLPILARLNIPSTLYLCTKHFLEGWPVPAVAVRYIIWRSPLQAATLSGFVPSLDGEYDLKLTARRKELAERAEAWISVSFQEREAVSSALERFAECLGVSASELMLDSRRFTYLSQSELLEASANGCSIELHGHVHRYPYGDAASLEKDVDLCKQTITRMGLPEPVHYCYPSGGYDGSAASILGRIGVSSATTCTPGLVSRLTKEDYYYLPRFLDGENISQLEFEAEMSGFTTFIRQSARKLRDIRDQAFRNRSAHAS